RPRTPRSVPQLRAYPRGARAARPVNQRTAGGCGPAGVGEAPMIHAVAVICLVILSLAAVLCLIRMVKGPTMLDRAVASDVFIAIVAIGLGVEAAVHGHDTTVPVLAVLALVAFLGTVSIALFV